jgi:hypothetical protein
MGTIQFTFLPCRFLPLSPPPAIVCVSPAPFSPSLRATRVVCATQVCMYTRLSHLSSFSTSSTRPKPLRPTFWAFLFPPVPLIPPCPRDVSDAGRSPARDAELFPSDEQLSQRTLWDAFIIVLGLAILGLCGALPLYLVSTPCLADSAPPASYHGIYSTLQDLSLLRLLRLLDNGQVTSTGLHSRESVNGKQVRTRIIILTVLAIVLGVLPALHKLIKEFNRTVAYRHRWLEIRCEQQDLGWLSIRHAPGFRTWGEKQLKDFLLQGGLSSSLDSTRRPRGSRFWNGTELSHSDETFPEVDIQNLFTIGCALSPS